MDTRGLPAGPRLPLLQTLLYLRDPYRYLARCRDRYGDPFTARGINTTTVVVGSPAGAQQIYTADPDTFLPYIPDGIRPLIGESSLFLLTGATHRRERKLLMPAFHGERLHTYGETIREAALAAAARWPHGRVFVFQDSSQSISLEILLRTVYGVTDPARVEAFRAAILEYVAAARPLLLYFAALQHPAFGPWARLQRAQARCGELLADELAARRAAPSAERDDVLSLMLRARRDDGSAMSDAELRDALATLLFAGHETTAIALAWAVHWLLRDRTCLARLLAELDAAGERPPVDVLTRLPYLDAVVHEALRLHPILPDPYRLLARPLALCGYTVPAGATVVVAASLLHTDPGLYPDPHRFAPERFLARRFGPFEYVPFGGGHRRCLGAAFALHELKLVLATLLARFRLELAEPGEVRPGRRNIALGPSTGVRVIFRGPRAPGDPP
jgi:cytochrome P450